MELDTVIDQTRRFFYNLKSQNRYGVVAEIKVDNTAPQITHVLIDRGQRDVYQHGVTREFKEIIVATKRIVEENWSVRDLVYVSWLKGVKKIAGYAELEEKGALIGKIYSNFLNWSNIPRD